MLYIDGKQVARYLLRDRTIVSIIEHGRQSYHNDPQPRRATSMRGLKVTALADNSTITFTTSDGNPTDASWPLQYSRGWGWHDIEWNRTVLRLPTAGDCVWLRPKGKFFYSTGNERIGGTGRWQLDGNLRHLFNPDGYAFATLDTTSSIQGMNLFGFCDALCGHLQIDGNMSAWNFGLSQFDDVFEGCTGITSVTIADDVDDEWNFEGCSSLAEISAPHVTYMPRLAGTAVTEAWFPSALYDSPNAFNPVLQRVILPRLTELRGDAFWNCSSLAYIRVGITSWGRRSGNGWVDGVAANGTFIKHAALPLEFGPDRIPTGWTVLVDTPQLTATGNDYDSARSVTLTTQLPDADIYFTTDGTEPSDTNGTRYTSPLYITATTTIRAVAIDQYGPSDILTQTVEVRHALAFEAQTASTVELTATGGYITDLCPDLEYSVGGTTWATLAVNTAISLAAGQRLYIRASQQNWDFYSGASDRIRFTMTGTLKAKGSVMSLLDPTWYHDGAPSIDYNDALHGLFEDCTSLIGPAPELPALTGEARCYYAMFKGCTGLTRADIGLTSLSAASECACMFQGCTSLKAVFVHFSAWNDADLATADWMDGVAAKGSFRAPSALPVVNDASHIPTGWGSMAVANLIDAADELFYGSFDAD